MLYSIIIIIIITIAIITITITIITITIITITMKNMIILAWHSNDSTHSVANVETVPEAAEPFLLIGNAHILDRANMICAEERNTVAICKLFWYDLNKPYCMQTFILLHKKKLIILNLPRKLSIIGRHNN